MANEMLWSTQSGFLSNAELDMQFAREAQPRFRFRQFVAIKKAFGKSKGESVNWLQVSNAGTYGGSLAETQTMHEATQPLAFGTLTVNEYGLSIPFTQKVESLSKFDVQDIMRGSLLDDAAKVMDGTIEREFNSCSLHYVGTAATAGVLTTDATVAAVNSSVFNRYHLRTMVNQLKIRNVPGVSKVNGDYAGVLSVEAMDGLFSDFESSAVNVEPGYTAILNGEMTKYYGVRLVEDTWASRYTFSASARTATAVSWSNSKSLPAYIFGYPTVREAIVIPEGIRMKVTTDYGRSKGIAWYALLGWRIEWAADESTCRIIKWDSAS